MTTPLPCPICGRPPEPGAPAPFCSRRCADVDLGRWFTGRYSIPDEAPTAEDDPEVDQSRFPG